MFTIKAKDTNTKCFIKLLEIYPLYRRMVCGLFDKSEYHFTKTQQMIIMTLWLKKDMSLTQLSDRICTSNEQATRAVGQLVRSGHVTRIKNASNRRTIDISLTEKGRAAVMDA